MGRWTYCEHCGSIGFVDWGYEIHMDIGACPNAASWRGVGEEVINRAAEECDRLNDLEAIETPQSVDFEELAAIPSTEEDDPYATFAYRGGNP